MTEPHLTLIHNAALFAPEPCGLSSLLIGGGKVLWLGCGEPPDTGALPVECIDLEGRRMIPGLVDGHAHLTGGGGEDGFRSRVPPLPLSRYTTAGVTSVIGVLGTDDLARSTRELVATAYALREQGLSAWVYTGGYHLPPTTLTGSVRADIVFIEPIIGVGELAISDHRSSQPTLDELLRIASEAHVAGMMSGKAGLLHLHLGNGDRGLQLVRQALERSELPARVFHPTHVNRRKRLFEEAIDLAGLGSCVDITAFPVDEDEDAWSAADALARYLERGAPPGRVSISSDGGGCLPSFDVEGRVERMDIGSPAALLETLGELLQRDFALEIVLPAFTANPAELLRLPGKGQLAVGCDADLVVLDEHHRARDVMARGVWHVQGGKPIRRGLFES